MSKAIQRLLPTGSSSTPLQGSIFSFSHKLALICSLPGSGYCSHYKSYTQVCWITSQIFEDTKQFLSSLSKAILLPGISFQPFIYYFVFYLSFKEQLKCDTSFWKPAFTSHRQSTRDHSSQQSPFLCWPCPQAFLSFKTLIQTRHSTTLLFDCHCVINE